MYALERVDAHPHTITAMRKEQATAVSQPMSPAREQLTPNYYDTAQNSRLVACRSVLRRPACLPACLPACHGHIAS